MSEEILEVITFLMTGSSNQYHQKSSENLRKLMDEAEEKAKNDGYYDLEYLIVNQDIFSNSSNMFAYGSLPYSEPNAGIKLVLRGKRKMWKMIQKALDIRN